MPPSFLISPHLYVQVLPSGWIVRGSSDGMAVTVELAMVMRRLMQNAI